MNKDELRELINKEIMNQAVNSLRSGAKKSAPAATVVQMTEDDMDTLLFNGGYRDGGFHKVYGLNEMEAFVPQIRTSEIRQFEAELTEVIGKYVNTTISFDKQGKQQTSITFKKGMTDLSILASGYINAGNDGKIRWMFSVPNGFKIETDGFEITQDNRDLISDLFNYYMDWQKNWKQRLVENPAEEAPGGMAAPNNSAPGEQPLV